MQPFLKESQTDSPNPTLLVPDAPSLAARGDQAVWLSPDGEIETISGKEAALRCMTARPYVCHARATARQLGFKDLYAYDVLELFAFVLPARFCVPTINGLALALGRDPFPTLEDQVTGLADLTRLLLTELQNNKAEKSDPAAIAWLMGLGETRNENGTGWSWAPAVLHALGKNTSAPDREALKVWRKLPEWSEEAPPPPPGHHAVTEKETRVRLTEFLSTDTAEPRPQQEAYAAALGEVFKPAEQANDPHIVLAEAGTGVGKTLGYLAPATVWAEKNDAPVWISTYTKNLQRQIDDEMARLYQDTALREHKVVLRKGRENYLCLLNLEDALQSDNIRHNGMNATALGLMLRWAAASRDGDMTGGDFPGWLPGLVGYGRTLAMADKRGECIYSACPHYHKCFIERSVRRARRADIVVANHALVLIQTALAGEDDELPARYIFDEGHHLFEAADSAFAGHLTGIETAELRRWILGREGRGRSRARGLKRRIEDLITDDPEAIDHLYALLETARSLPGPGWQKRLSTGSPKGITERFLAYVRQQVVARDRDHAGVYSLECPAQPPVDGLIDVARALHARLNDLRTPISRLTAILRQKLSEQADTLDPDTKRRLQAVIGSLQRRGSVVLAGWCDMLRSLEDNTPPEFVDWFGIERIDGREADIGFFRHWIDPTIPFAKAIIPHAHGIGITSASLRDTSGDEEQDWLAAESRTGTVHLTAQGHPVLRVKVPSPFNYHEQTRVIVLTDIGKNDPEQVAAACRELFKASNGGALGLFTAIQRLKAVHSRIKNPLEDFGIPLYAQHCDGLEVTTLIDMFRDDEHACLLGTDATRDGIDVPGRSLRLVVYDRMPWPRPSILHKARRKAFGERHYDEMLTRFRLKQAYGRLIRKADDKGVFVMLDSALPSRLYTAFPENVPVQRLGLADALPLIRDFLAP